MPVGGGGYFRLYPLSFTTSCLRMINAQGRPCMFYIHPWEVDPLQPRLRVAGPIKSFRHYLNLRRTEARLDQLLSRFRFGTMQAALDELDSKLSHAVAI